MPVHPLSHTAQWRYDKMRDGKVFLVSPAGDDYALIRGSSVEIRVDRASALVKSLNKR